LEGRTYRFKTCVANSIGDSDFSHEVIVGVGSKAPAPGAVLRDFSYESESSIKVNWTSVTASDLPITGYVLEMDDGLGGPFLKIYDGKENTQKLSFEVFNLVAQRIYRFRVYAINVNGAGFYSNETSL
jgi:hypothetical protein